MVILKGRFSNTRLIITSSSAGCTPDRFFIKLKLKISIFGVFFLSFFFFCVLGLITSLDDNQVIHVGYIENSIPGN